MSKPIIVPVNKFMSVTPQELNKGLKTNVIVKFDDGVEKPLTFREIVINRYVWEVLKLVPNMQILSEFDITNNYENGYYVSSTLNKTYESILKYFIFNAMEPTGKRDLLQPLWEKMQSTFNDIYNEIVFNNLDYVSSLDINTFLDVQLEPDLVKAMRNVSNVNINSVGEIATAIEEAYMVLHNIFTSDKYKDNRVAQGYISKTMKQGQIRQVLGPRGNITNLNEELFKKPIASSFTSGLYDISEIAMESQTGARSLKATTTAVSRSEYFARKLQLVMSRVERIVDGDCGNNKYVNWDVTEDSNDPNNLTKSNFNLLIGKWYFDKDANMEKLITKDDTHLIGKTILLRTAYKCTWKDKRCVCSKCFGHMSYSIPKHYHIGHYSATIMTKEITQKMLSLKHQIASANALNIDINKEAIGDIETKKDDNVYVYIKRRHVVTEVGGKKTTVHNNLKDYTLAIKVAVGSARGLSDITPNIDVKRFSPSSVSILHDLWLVKTNKKTGEITEVPLKIQKGRRLGSFTTEFLLHVQKVEKDIGMDNEENIHIPLDGWNMSDPFVIVPDVEFSYIAFMTNISKLFGATSDVSRRKESEDEDDGNSINTQEGFLYRIFTEVTSKLNINIALFEIMTAAFSVSNYEAGDFSVAHGCETGSTRNIKNIMSNSSAGAFYAYQEHLSTMTNPAAFDETNAVNHIMDVFLAPEETINDYNSNPIKF